MRIIEIEALSNGAHRNQTGDFSALPAGWAVIPEGMDLTAAFPFVEIQVADMPVGQADPETGETATVVTVTAMRLGVVPEPTAEAYTPTQLDRIEAQATYTAMMTDTLLEV